MAIAGEREVFDHEQLLFLRTHSYVLAKVAVGGLLSGVQTFVFTGLLYAFQRLFSSKAILLGPVGCWRASPWSISRPSRLAG